VPGIIDGRRWLAERRRHLESELGKGPDDEERRAIEAELAQLQAQAGTNRRRMWWRFWGARPPGQ
jgi:hypothetical protein